jgi:DNA polymerase-3 subunit epsilon
MREIAFDTETTGLDPFSGHRVIEIGCVEIIDRRITGNHFHAYMNPERDVPRAAMRVHGLTDEFLSDKPLFPDIAQGFVDFVAGDTLVIHNAAFDMKFINYELERCNRKALSYELTVDTLLMARKKFPGAKATLDALCQRFDISLERREKHGALLDAELLADMYLEMLGERQSSLHFLNQQQRLASGSASKATKLANVVEPRSFAPSPEELVAHQAFIAKYIPKPLWEE